MSSPHVDVPPGPWHSRIEAVVWWHRATPAAREALPAALAGRAAVPITIGGMIAYRDGPVGAYDEVFGAPLVLRGGLGLSHVAFMAVDSVRSQAGGRRNWALPKEIARFEGGVGAPGRAVARGQGWAIGVEAAVRRRGSPVWLRLGVVQVWPGDAVRAFAVTMRGRARPARAAVSHLEPSPVADWLVAGEHPAVLLSGAQVVSAPRRG